MIDTTLVTLAKGIAARHSLDGALVCAIIEQESGGDTWAVRYEPEFCEKYIAPRRADDLAMTPTRMVTLSMSWGLMQVMGQTAREAGWIGALPALCDPNAGIEIGCRVFAKKLTFSRGAPIGLLEDGDILAHALQLWNGGGNPNYSAQVLARVAQYR